MASLTRWTWVWVNSRSLWWTGRPGVLQFIGSQRVGHDWATELNWTELNWYHGYSLVIMALISPFGGNFGIYKTAPRIRFRIVCIALEKELNVFDHAYRLNFYYLISFGCFPFSLHFLTSLIKLALWLKFFHRQKIDWGRGARTIGSHSFSAGMWS